MTRAEHPMTRRVVVIPPELPLGACWQIMQREGFRHLPVVASERAIGMLSDRDVLAHSQISANGELAVPDMPAADAMSLTLHACQPSTDVGDLVAMMTELQIDAVLVLEDDDLVGLVTTTDLLLLLIELDGARVPIPFDFELERRAARGLVTSHN